MVKEYTISNNDTDDGNLENDAKRNRLINIKVGKGKKESSDYFFIPVIYTETYNKCYNYSASQNGIWIVLRKSIMCTQVRLCLPYICNIP